MKLCFPKLKISLLFLPLFLLGIFSAAPAAKAVDTVYLQATTSTMYADSGIYKQDIFVPSTCGNNYLIIQEEMTYTISRVVPTIGGVNLNGPNNNYADQFYHYTNNGHWYSFMATSSPLNATTTITFNNNSSIHAHTALFCNVDQATPYVLSPPTGEYGSIAPNPGNRTIYNAVYGGMGLIMGSYDTTVGGSNLLSKTNIFNYVPSADYIYWDINWPSIGTTTVAGYTGYIGAFDLMLLNYSAYVPPELTSIYTFGYPYLWSLDNSIFQMGEDKKFIVSWNACAEYGELNESIIYAVINDDQTDTGAYAIYNKQEFSGPQQCKGIITYFSDNYLVNNDDESGEVYFILVNYDANGNLISSKKSNVLNFTTDLTGTYVDSLMEDPLLIDLGSLPQGVQTATSTTLFFTYDFTDENAASTTVILWDYSAVASTGYEQDGPFVSSGVGWSSITIPTPATSTFKTYRFVAVRPGFSNLQSAVFSVDWNWHANIYNNVCEPPTYDFSHLCDEYNTGPGLDYILGNMMCGIKYGITVGFTALFTPTCKSLNYFQEQYEKFKLSFPVNIFFDFIGTLNDAIDAGVASSTDQVLSVPFIRKTSTSTEYYSMPVVSSSSYSNLLGSDNYNKIRIAEEYIYWILAAIAVYFIIVKKKI